MEYIQEKTSFDGSNYKAENTKQQGKLRCKWRWTLCK